jgi:hypothetical protein
MPFENRGWYAFYFPSDDYDKHRVRIQRSEEGIVKQNHRLICELCGEETTIFTMKKPSSLKFREVSRKHGDDVLMVEPGQMRLPGEEISQPQPGTAISSIPDFIEIEQPYRVDKVYSDLIDEINTCFEYEAYSSTMVMLRKLIENLIIAILRFKYSPTDNHEMYFDENSGHFLQLNTLVSNFEKISSDYKDYGFTKNHLATIKGLRKKGNHSAHSIIDFMTKSKMKSIKSNANQAVKVLLLIIGIERGKLDKKGQIKKK